MSAGMALFYQENWNDPIPHFKQALRHDPQFLAKLDGLSIWEEAYERDSRISGPLSSKTDDGPLQEASLPASLVNYPRRVVW